MLTSRTLTGQRPRAFSLPRAEFWRLWGAAVLFAALALGVVCGTARADEDLFSPQAFFRQESARHQPVPDAGVAVRAIGHFAHRHVLAPALIGGEQAYRGVRDTVGAASGVVGQAMRYLGHGNPTGTGSHDWCADFANMVLRQSGHHAGPSRRARDTVRAGRPIAGPVPGAIMSLPHHTGFVVRILGPGRVLLVSGNHGHKVGLGVYSTRGARFAMPA